MKLTDTPDRSAQSDNAARQTDFSARKKILRAAMRGRRKALPEKERAALSLTAQNRLLSSPEWQKASSVALYMAVHGEVDAGALLSDAWSTGKRVLLPLCSPDIRGHMDLVICDDLRAMRPGPYGIPEPNPERLPGGAAEPGALPKFPPPDLLVIPGVAFDKRGYRLGMGGGYYDRLLHRTEYANCLRIGMAFAFQIVDELPREAWDKPVHALCTEEGILWTHHP